MQCCSKETRKWRKLKGRRRLQLCRHRSLRRRPLRLGLRLPALCQHRGHLQCRSKGTHSRNRKRRRRFRMRSRCMLRATLCRRRTVHALCQHGDLLQCRTQNASRARKRECRRQFRMRGDRVRQRTLRLWLRMPALCQHERTLQCTERQSRPWPSQQRRRFAMHSMPCDRNRQRRNMPLRGGSLR